MAAMDLYVYYRVRSVDAPAFCAQALAMQHTLAREHGVATALKRRPEEKDGLHTWMEVYSSVDDDFAAHLDQAVADCGLASLIDGVRHSEQFLDVFPCA
jgi:hypothetical protein